MLITRTKIVAFGAAGLMLAPLAAGAATNSANTVINAELESVIAVTSSSPVTLSITPVTGGVQTTASDTVSVSTNHAGGYNLTLADANSTTTLANGGNTIAAHAG